MGNPKEGDIILDNTTKNSSSKVDEINVANTLSKELTDNFDFMENKSIEDIQNFFNKHKNDIRFAKYLNNFDFNVEGAVRQELPALMRKLDPKTEKPGTYISEEMRKFHSPLYADQTIENFRKSIRESILDTGLTIDELECIYEQRDVWTKRGKYTERRETILKLIRPVYILLRKKGYTNHDLTN